MLCRCRGNLDYTNLSNAYEDIKIGKGICFGVRMKKVKSGSSRNVQKKRYDTCA